MHFSFSVNARKGRDVSETYKNVIQKFWILSLCKILYHFGDLRKDIRTKEQVVWVWLYVKYMEYYSFGTCMNQEQKTDQTKYLLGNMNAIFWILKRQSDLSVVIWFWIFFKKRALFERVPNYAYYLEKKSNKMVLFNTCGLIWFYYLSPPSINMI